MTAGRVHTVMAPKTLVVVAVITILSISFLAPSLVNTGYENQRIKHQVTDTMALGYVPPVAAPVDFGDDPSPSGWVDGDFIISFDEEETVNHALNPSMAFTPYEQGIPEEWMGTMHAVWHEEDEVTGDLEIHYSANIDRDPYKWTGENEDRVISFTDKNRARSEARNASICVDSIGMLHVVWTEFYQDGTWEIHYSRSDDNGKTWTSDYGPDIVVSGRGGKGGDATSPPDPRIAVGLTNNGKAPEDPLYVVWTENYQYEVQEVHFSRSFNHGINWTGSDIGDLVLSDVQFANNPSIVASGDHGEVVSVVWEQHAGGDPQKSKEIYFTRSPDYGTSKTWSQPEMISDPEFPPVLMNIGNVEMTSSGQDMHVIWDQAQRDQGKAEASGIFYSFHDGNAWKTVETQIDRPDGNPPVNPTISAFNLGGKAPLTFVQVTWSEMETDLEYPSMEIHTSFSENPFDPLSWSGQDKDIVLSWPDNDPEIDTDAMNPSMVMWENGPDNYEPMFVWTEMNNPSGKGRGQPNTEIHTVPPALPVTYTITATAGSHGSITPSGTVTVPEGDDQTFYFYPDTGYHVSNVYVDGSPQGASSSYTFNNVNADHTIDVSFSINYYTLNTYVSPSGQGSVTKNPNQGSYAHGTWVTLTANPVTGWHFSHWSGSMSGSSNPDSIYMNGNKAVTANFAIDTFTITASAGTGGSITPSGAVSVDYGDDQAFVISASSGYAIKDVLVDSISQGDISSYTFYGVDDDHTIEAQFIPKYEKVLVAGWNRISFPLEQVDTSIETVLDSIDAYWDEARFFNGATQNWQTYTNGVGGTLTDVDHEMGIWVHVSGSCTLTVTGDRPSTTTITLRTGWNMIGYPAGDDSTYDVADLKADVSAVQLVYREDWRYIMTELGDSTVLQNGELYWVLVSSDTTWTITW